MSEFLYSFNEGSRNMKGLLGEKGANLAEMTAMGLPVPFGFVVTTEACRKFFRDGNTIVESVMEQLHEKIQELEEVTGKKFGSGENPLLVSVRTSSVVNIPTMADTVLNLGLNDKTVSGLAKLGGSNEFALDSYSRFIRMYGSVVKKIPQAVFVSTYEKLKSKESLKTQYSEEELLYRTVEEYKKIILRKTGKPFPQEPYLQLKEVISAMLGYWNSYATMTYREFHEISRDIGVALVVQAMVFGNLDDDSCIGTVFTRDPRTGLKGTCGRFIVKAQGGDLPFADSVVRSIEEMEDFFPDVYRQFIKIAALLEKHYRDMQEIEFTVESGKLYMLQTKKGRRSPEAAIKIAVELVEEKIVDRKTAVAGIKSADVDKLIVDAFHMEAKMRPEVADNFRTIMTWVDEFRVMGVRANIDTPEDAGLALQMGADGIGLCRSEHMFFGEERIYDFIRLIMAESDRERSRALEVLRPYQTEDFRKIFLIMEDRPVTIRLLDPSLHKFMPKSEEEIRQLAGKLHMSEKKLAAKIKVMHEENPLMGKRGARLAVSYPDIARMQTEAIITAAIEAGREMDGMPDVSVMIPFVSTAREFSKVRSIVDEAAAACFENMGETLDYSVGTMIETPRAALMSDKIAERADFFSFGTNDLTELVYGLSRSDTENLVEDYVKKDLLDRNPFYSLDQRGVGKLISMAASDGRKARPKLKMGLCGDHGGDAETIKFCRDIELNFVSCSTLRIPGARLAAAQAAIDASVKND